MPIFSINTTVPVPSPSQITPFPFKLSLISVFVPCFSTHLTRTSASLPVGLTPLGQAALNAGAILSIKAYEKLFLPSLSCAPVSSMKPGRTLKIRNEGFVGMRSRREASAAPFVRANNGVKRPGVRLACRESMGHCNSWQVGISYPFS